MSGARSRNKGAGWERKVAAWLRSKGYCNAHRRERGTAITKDIGDIGGVPFVVECKNETGTLGLKGFYTHGLRYLKQLDGEMQVEENPLGLVVVKRPGKASVDEAIVMMPAKVWMRFVNFKMEEV